MLSPLTINVPLPLLLSMTVTPPAAPPELAEPIAALISRVLPLVSNVAPPKRTSISFPAEMTKLCVACRPPPLKTSAELLPPRLPAPAAATNPPASTRLPDRPVRSAPLRSSVALPVFVSEPLPVSEPLKTVGSPLPPTVSATAADAAFSRVRLPVPCRPPKVAAVSDPKLNNPPPLLSNVVSCSASAFPSASCSFCPTVVTPPKVLSALERVTTPLPEPLLTRSRPACPLTAPGTLTEHPS